MEKSLKPLDIKLISYLYHNNRESLTKIAKETKLSREQVDYKIKKYLEKGIIKKFATFFNYESLGYNYLVILFLKFSDKEKIKAFEKEFKQSKHCISSGAVFNKYDLFLNLIFKDEKDFRDSLNFILGRDKGLILDYLILKPFFIEKYPLKFLKNKKEESIEITEKSKKIKLDQKELEILRILEEDGRIKIIDIAKKINLSAELVLYKLKKLYQKKVILGSRILFDMKRLGYFFSIISLEFNNLSIENQAKIKNFARSSQFVNSLFLTMSKPNCFIQLFHKNEFELRSQIDKLKELFGENEFSNLDVLLIEGEQEANTLPFLKK
ncbi:Lrp/AsnC family transcriptional regulator [Candidatus Pacearchaeota archaeon]|nr:Lrp/AsnC family transcriptional regulator [Candidatus Pacearchaeota archaeon]